VTLSHPAHLIIEEVALQIMQQCGVTITSTEMVMYELPGKAGTDSFREVLKLVK
jgi:hypothetical protein